MYKKDLVFAAACIGMLLFGIGLITLGSVAPDLRSKFQLDEISAGILFSILPIGILIGSLLFGPVADRYGYKWLFVIACAGLFTGFEGIAYSSSVNLLRLSIFLFGVFSGVINGATNAVVSDISSEAKGANLSLLGVFFGIGALGMPFMLRILRDLFSFEQIIGFTGLLSLIVGLFYSFIQFPLSKKALGFALAKTKMLFKDGLLILIGLFLFCQSGFEAIINNWITSYLSLRGSVEKENALYALSLFVTGMTVMRLLIGSLFRSVSTLKLLSASFTIVLAGILLLNYGHSFNSALTGLILLGMGLAGGFPIMLGIVGQKYADRSGTAFSFVLVFALTGNMLVNYLMGVIAARWGLGNLTTIAFIEFCLMMGLFGLISARVRRK